MLSSEDAQGKDDWRLRIMGATSEPGFNGKMAVKMMYVMVQMMPVILVSLSGCCRQWRSLIQRAFMSSLVEFNVFLPTHCMLPQHHSHRPIRWISSNGFTHIVNSQVIILCYSL